MKKPNFFIVGAPKCGTTALSRYLQTHPRIFFSGQKELNYFDTDFSETFRRRASGGLCRSDEEYLAQFRGAKDSHLMVGEGTVWYLVSEVAIANIRRFNPDAKLIVMLRNPVDMAPSAHWQDLFDGSEDVRDFRAAWQLQSARRQGLNIPPTCAEPKHLQYRHTCLLGSHLKRLLDVFPRRQVLTILFDDFVADTQGVYEETLAFLGVPSDGRNTFPRIHERKEHRFLLLNKFLLQKAKTPRLLGALARATKKALGVSSLGIRPLLLRLNTRPQVRQPLPPDFRRELVETFADDVKLLEELLGRKLDQWRNVECPAGSRQIDSSASSA
jgi:hypothetical protein